MEQISETQDTNRDFVQAYRLMALHSGLTPEEGLELVGAVSGAITAARIEGEKAGMEKARRIALDYIWSEGAELHSNQAVANNTSQNIAAAIRALAKELPNDH